MQSAAGGQCDWCGSPSLSCSHLHGSSRSDTPAIHRAIVLTAAVELVFGPGTFPPPGPCGHAGWRRALQEVPKEARYRAACRSKSTLWNGGAMTVRRTAWRALGSGARQQAVADDMGGESAAPPARDHGSYRSGPRSGTGTGASEGGRADGCVLSSQTSTPPNASMTSGDRRTGERSSTGSAATTAK